VFGSVYAQTIAMVMMKLREGANAVGGQKLPVIEHKGEDSPELPPAHNGD
jgi:hypothetical protein